MPEDFYSYTAKDLVDELSSRPRYYQNSDYVLVSLELREKIIKELQQCGPKSRSYIPVGTLHAYPAAPMHVTLDTSVQLPDALELPLYVCSHDATGRSSS